MGVIDEPAGCGMWERLKKAKISGSSQVEERVLKNRARTAVEGI